MTKSFKNVVETSLKTSKPILAFNIQNMPPLKALAVASKKNNINVIAQFSEKYFALFSNNFDFIKIKNHYKNYNVHFFLDHYKKILFYWFLVLFGFSLLFIRNYYLSGDFAIFDLTNLLNKKLNYLVNFSRILLGNNTETSFILKST